MAGSVIQGFFAPGRHGPGPGLAEAAAGGRVFRLLQPVCRPSGPGQPLPDALQRQMEGLFGASFAAVRVHVGPQASILGAEAYAQGTDLHFAPGRYCPETPEGRRLIAHELAHVVQQRAGRVRNPFGSGVALVQDPAMEAEAERMAQRAARPGSPAGPATVVRPRAGAQTGVQGGAVQMRPGRPITFGDFFWPAYREHRARRAPVQAPQAPVEPSLDLGWLFPDPPPPQAPVVAPVAQAPQQGGQRRGGRRRGVPLPLGPALTPLQVLASAGNPAPDAGPIRFPYPGGGIHHEYTYNVPGGPIYIHVHRNNGGYASSAHAKPARLRYVTGTVTTGAADPVATGALGTYGILNRDTT